MFQYLFRLLKNLPSMRFHGLFNYNVYCADCTPSPGLIFWIHLFECTYQGFRKEREGSGRGAGLPWGNRRPLSTTYSYPCYLCYLRVTKMHCWEKSNTFWTYMHLRGFKHKTSSGCVTTRELEVRSEMNVKMDFKLSETIVTDLEGGFTAYVCQAQNRLRI